MLLYGALPTNYPDPDPDTKFASLWRHKLSNVTHLFIYFSDSSLFRTEIFECAKNHSVVTQKIL